ncbi:MAG: twin-arginine translocase subunit TatC [Cellvibrionaceae bacterium]
MSSEPANQPQGTVIDHLIELRGRLLKIVVVIFTIFFAIVIGGFSNEIYTLFSAPLTSALPQGSQMIATEVASPFITPFKLSFILSFFLAMPYVLYQLWGFVAPGLYKQEKHLAALLLITSSVLFYAGIAFAYFVTFPIIFDFFSMVAPEGVAVMTDITRYMDFALKLFFAFGVAFEIPVATVVLIRTGITTPEALTEKRPYVILGCFVIGMLMTPPDVFSQALLALPMWLLFEAGVFLGKFISVRDTHQART